MRNAQTPDRADWPELDAPCAALGPAGEFIELEGGSGALYRFRAASLDRLANVAANFVFVRSAAGGSAVICCGSANSVMRATAAWREAVERYQVDHMFIYLNTIRRSREQVHADLVARSQPLMAAPELDG
jgi:hypothetical protein